MSTIGLQDIAMLDGLWALEGRTNLQTGVFSRQAGAKIRKKLCALIEDINHQGTDGQFTGRTVARQTTPRPPIAEPPVSCC